MKIALPFLLLMLVVSMACTKSDDGRPRFNTPYGATIVCVDVKGVGPNITLTLPITTTDVQTYNLCKVDTPTLCTYSSAGACP